ARADLASCLTHQSPERVDAALVQRNRTKISRLPHQDRPDAIDRGAGERRQGGRVVERSLLPGGWARQLHAADPDLAPGDRAAPEGGVECQQALVRRHVLRNPAIAGSVAFARTIAPR